MTFADVLERIMNHEMNIQEANNIKNLYKGVSTSKKAIIESPSEEEEEEEEEDEKEYDEEDMTLFIKKLNKYIKKRRPYKGDRKEKPRSKRVC
jgi:NACalpha-BTF3-like transcription factor